MGEAGLGQQRQGGGDVGEAPERRQHIAPRRGLGVAPSRILVFATRVKIRLWTHLLTSFDHPRDGHYSNIRGGYKLRRCGTQHFTVVCVASCILRHCSSRTISQIAIESREPWRPRAEQRFCRASSVSVIAVFPAQLPLRLSPSSTRASHGRRASASAASSRSTRALGLGQRLTQQRVVSAAWCGPGRVTLGLGPGSALKQSFDPVLNSSLNASASFIAW